MAAGRGIILGPAESFSGFSRLWPGGGIQWAREEVSGLDLRNNRITMGELLADPRSRQVLARHFPQAMDLPILAKAGTMTLATAMKLGAAYVPRKAIEAALAELRQL